jgi:thymidine kinase
MFCHRKGQLILMADGTLKPIEEIRTGDRVVSDQGLPVLVTAIHRGSGAMAEIRPARGGDPFVVTLDHELTLMDTPSRPYGKPCERGGRVLDVSVRDWLTWSDRRKSIFKLFRVGVPAFDSLGVGDDDLDPYFLGAMLGDGSFDSRIGLVSMDPEIIAEAERQAQKYGLRVAEDAPRGKARTVRLVGRRGVPNPIANRFRALGLYGLTGADKFIPQRYLSATQADRLELLAGLLDTDGSATQGAGFDFINKSPHLARGVAFLARSVGLAATVRISHKKAQTGPVRPYYRVYVGGDVSKVPTRLPRKQLERKVKHRPTVTTFDVGVLSDPEPYFGITVEGGRYLLGDFTVTHNSGKSEELIRRVRRAQFAKQAVKVFKPAVDDRYATHAVVSHVNAQVPCIPVQNVTQISEHSYESCDVIAIDEAQFFAPGLVLMVDVLAQMGKRVIVAGLDLDSFGEPFGPMADLLVRADYITKLHAVCVCCGEDATRSYRKSGGTNQVEVGADQYEARCRACYNKGGKT